jgi:hypothetical protein
MKWLLMPAITDKMTAMEVLHNALGEQRRAGSAESGRVKCDGVGGDTIGQLPK